MEVCGGVWGMGKGAGGWNGCRELSSGGGAGNKGLGKGEGEGDCGLAHEGGGGWAP